MSIISTKEVYIEQNNYKHTDIKVEGSIHVEVTQLDEHSLLQILALI